MLGAGMRVTSGCPWGRPMAGLATEELVLGAFPCCVPWPLWGLTSLHSLWPTIQTTSICPPWLNPGLPCPPCSGPLAPSRQPFLFSGSDGKNSFIWGLTGVFAFIRWSKSTVFYPKQLIPNGRISGCIAGAFWSYVGALHSFQWPPDNFTVEAACISCV